MDPRVRRCNLGGKVVQRGNLVECYLCGKCFTLHFEDTHELKAQSQGDVVRREGALVECYICEKCLILQEV